jgi:formylmethanofuran dehydrogenase subunit C
MKPTVLVLRARPPERLDLSPLVPHRLAGQSAAAIEAIELQTTRHKIRVADAFHLRLGDVERIRIEGGCDRLDRIGEQMTGGEIVVEGDAGIVLGRRMSGGQLTVKGHVGPMAASGMSGGRIEISGNAGDRLGGPLAGETAGMRGGVVVVRGNAGERIADRMRRGTIIVEGRAGPYAGSRMIAGTLIVRRRSGALPGYLMARGTIILGDGAEEVSPTFADCGIHDLLGLRLLASFVAAQSRKGASSLRKRLRRLAGDMAVLGRGELFIPEQE